MFCKLRLYVKRYKEPIVLKWKYLKTKKICALSWNRIRFNKFSISHTKHHISTYQLSALTQFGSEMSLKNTTEGLSAVIADWGQQLRNSWLATGAKIGKNIWVKKCCYRLYKKGLFTAKSLEEISIVFYHLAS